MDTQKDFCYRHWLVNQIKDRQSKNPSFSLRAFARVVGLSPSHLSNIIAAKRPLTHNLAEKISRRLDLAPKDQLTLYRGIENQKSKKPKSNLSFKEISASNFQIVEKWYYFAILGLASVKPNEASPKWISKRLLITEPEAKNALKLLIKMQFIKKDEAGGFIPSDSHPLMTKKDIPSLAIQQFHNQILDLASKSLSKDSVEKRYFGFRSIACNPQILPQIKDKIRDFHNELTDYIHQNSEAHSAQVFALSTQFFPLDQGDQI